MYKVEHMEEELKLISNFESVQDNKVESMAPYLRNLWFKIITKSIVRGQTVVR